MRRAYHSFIFYPDDKAELEKLAERKEKLSPKKAIIVPHMDLRRAANLYQEAFRYIPDASRIIALIPIHSERLASDSDSIVFEENSNQIETPLGNIDLTPLGIEKQDAYAKEEFSTELILPYVLSSVKNYQLSVVYVKAENSEECKKLSRLIEKWNDDNTFFIISSNLTDRLNNKDEVEKEKKKALDYLESGDKLLDIYRKGHISICASPIIDALSRVIPGKWKPIATLEDTITGHASLYKETL